MTDQDFFRQLVLELSKTSHIGGNTKDMPYCVAEARSIYLATKKVVEEFHMDSIFIQGSAIIDACKRAQLRKGGVTPFDEK